MDFMVCFEIIAQKYKHLRENQSSSVNASNYKMRNLFYTPVVNSFLQYHFRGITAAITQT